MFSIGDLARKTGVKVPTIRYYEEMELLDKPERTGGNQRRYSSEDMQKLSFIKHSRELGFTIDDIRELLALSKNGELPCIGAHEIATQHLLETQGRIRKLKRLEKELKRILACESTSIGDCIIIESLADHGLCSGEH